MKLEKFKEKDSKKKGIIIFTISCMVLIIGVYFSSSFALFETKEVFNLIEGNIENIGDLSFTYYIDDQIALASPEKNSGKAFDSSGSYCTNDANLRWDYEEWGAVVTNISSTKTKCFLKFKTKYTEEILNGTDPVLKEGLIPVTIDDNGTVHIADISKEWYKYGAQRWANAIILNDESTRNQYTDIIPESAIESYFVWIPKYRYQLWDLGKYDGSSTIDESKIHTIPVIFGDYNASDGVNGECTTPMNSGNSGNCKVGDYMTHPAFLSIPSTGFWVGKFETSKKNSNADNSINSEGVQIKPNVISWRNINVSNAFYTTYYYKRDLDSHMMKNTEWGSVAYLSYSEYGSHLMLNKNTHDNLTGFSGENNPYNTSVGYLASTTGNITGIYDLEGGGWEYVMGVMANEKGEKIIGRSEYAHSGFAGTYGCPSCDSSNVLQNLTGLGWPRDVYYDTYTYSTENALYNRNILGDATGELGPFVSLRSSWYNNEASYINHGWPCFIRTLFSFSGTDGSGKTEVAFRIILTIN